VICYRPPRQFSAGSTITRRGCEDLLVLARGHGSATSWWDEEHVLDGLGFEYRPSNAGTTSARRLVAEIGILSAMSGNGQMTCLNYRPFCDRRPRK
jgi:hypothetical protein